MSGPTWLGVARIAACCLIGAPLTYAAFYAGLFHEAATTLERLPNLILIALSVTLGGMLAGGLRWPRLLYPAGLLAGFLVFGHIVWGVAELNRSAAFVLSNTTELALALVLTFAAGAHHADAATPR